MKQLSLPGMDSVAVESDNMGMQDHQRESKRSKGTSSTQPTPSGDGWKGFVNVELTDTQKPLVKALMTQGDHLWTVVWDLIDAGYKLTMSNDPSHNSYNVSMTCRVPKDPNNGLTLTGRGGTVLGAMASFVFKHETILEGRWDTIGSNTPRKPDQDYLA